MMTAELINTLLVLGAAQGLFLALLLATKEGNSTANKILAVAMLAFSVFLVEGLYYAQAYHERFPHVIGVSKPLVLLFGPVFYLYAQTVSAGGHVFRKASLLHFVPFLLVTLYLVPFYAQSGAAKLAFLATLTGEGPPPVLAVIEHLAYPHGILYVVLTVRLLQHHRARLKTTHSSLTRVNLLWLRNLTVGVAAVWVLVTGLHVLNAAGGGFAEVESRLTLLAVALLIYGIGYLGLKQSEIFSPPPRGAGSSLPEQVPHVVANASVAGWEPGSPSILDDSAVPEAPPAAHNELFGYEKSGLTRDQAEALGQQLVRLMEDEQPFKKSRLTLQDLADEMAISAHNLSEVINAQMQQSFYDFVNGYRVEEVKQRLRDPRSRHLTILALAEESGFNSKSAFNALFKKHTGQTPSQYRQHHASAAAGAS